MKAGAQLILNDYAVRGKGEKMADRSPIPTFPKGEGQLHTALAYWKARIGSQFSKCEDCVVGSLPLWGRFRGGFFPISDSE